MTNLLPPYGLPSLSPAQMAVLKTAFVALAYGADMADLITALSTPDLEHLATACAAIRSAALRERWARGPWI